MLQRQTTHITTHLVRYILGTYCNHYTKRLQYNPSMATKLVVLQSCGVALEVNPYSVRLPPLFSSISDEIKIQMNQTQESCQFRRPETSLDAAYEVVSVARSIAFKGALATSLTPRGVGGVAAAVGGPQVALHRRRRRPGPSSPRCGASVQAPASDGGREDAKRRVPAGDGGV